MAPQADVVIVGAGPSGAALATMLGHSGLSSVLLDRARFPRDKPCGEGLMPAGVRALEGIGMSLDEFPELKGVTYRLPGSGAATGTFAGPRGGRAARRLVFDTALFEHAAGTRGVDARAGCAVSGVVIERAKVTVKTSEGDVTGRYLVGARGLHSPVAHWMGRWRPPAGRHRYALTGHVTAPRHGIDRVIVTLLGDCEVYAAPTGPDERLVA